MDQAEHLRTTLRRLGARRKDLARSEAALKRDTVEALAAVRGIVAMKEAAMLVGLGRATVYQDYLGGNGAHETGARDRRAAGSPGRSGRS